jgi:hypothetical protein
MTIGNGDKLNSRPSTSISFNEARFGWPPVGHARQSGVFLPAEEADGVMRLQPVTTADRSQQWPLTH